MNITFIPTRPNLNYPPVPSSSVVTEKFKRIPNKNPSDKMDTVKNCMPMIEHITSGYVIRTNHDINIKQSYRNGVMSFDVQRDLDVHPFNQLPVGNQRRNYLKFMNHWLIKTPPGYSSMFYQPQNFETRFVMFSGIVSTDSYEDTINFPGYIVTEEEQFTIEAGTPLVTVFPFDREDWTSSVLEYDPKYRVHVLEDSVNFKENKHHYRDNIHDKLKYK
jgi:hypothetical protein